MSRSANKIEVAVYYFPQYHPDPRNDAWHGHGWTEWELMKLARPRFPGHRQPIHRGAAILPVESVVKDFRQIAETLGCSSIGSYTWVHHYNIQLDGFPHGNYARAAAANYAAWEEHEKMFAIPYHLNVTMGWDSSPRTIQSDVYECVGYPWCSVLDGNTPDAFKSALERAKAFVTRPCVKQPIVTINAWNEWTEGSYVLPDTVYGNGYLEAIRDVFGG